MPKDALYDGRFEVSRRAHEDTIYTRMTGLFSREQMEAWCREYRAATDSFNSKEHVVLADMRGMRPSAPDVAAIMGETIGYARQRGVVCCAHLSDDTIQRLQAGRIAREASKTNDATVDVVSLEEAERVLAEIRHAISKRLRQTA